MPQDTILVIDDEPKIGWIFSKILGNEYNVLSAKTGREGLAMIKKARPDLVFLDVRLPDTPGVELLQEVRKIEKNLLVIMLTACESVQTAVEAMKLGAYDYLTKPVPNGRLKIVIKNALETRRLEEKVHTLESRLEKRFALEDIKGTSACLQRVLDLIRRVARHDVNVLLIGESGTGKELVARAIHSESDRSDQPFIPVDCSAIPEALIESELFGHEKGAYTGAISAQAGKFESAKKGTLFFDEIGNLPKSIQAKLLRVIQERELFRLGATKPIHINVHLIAATNRDLSKAVSTGEFREDLYHRLNVFPISLPPLRERTEDILLLSRYFLEKFSKELGKSVKGLSREAQALLTHYRWPGNVREVENAVKHALLMVSDGEKTILPKHLPEPVREAASLSQPVGDGSLRTASKDASQKVERELILKTLKETNWNKRRASRILKIDYKTLFNKLKEHSIPARMS